MPRIGISPVKIPVPTLSRYENVQPPSGAFQTNTQSASDRTGTLAVFCEETAPRPKQDLPVPYVSRALHAQTPSPNKIRVGNTLYTELEKLGSGGYSVVHKVKSPDNKTYALKRVRLDGPDGDLLPDLKSEIQILNLLKGCSHVVQLYAFETTSNLITMVMERGDRDMHEIMHSGGWAQTSAQFYVSQLLACVAEVHARGIVHSDLKPANFIMCMGTLKLIDFGISSRIPDSTCHIYKETAIGTLSYMAPETLRESTCVQSLKYGKPSDMWSLGCIIHEMFYGAPPFAKWRRQQVEVIAGPTPVSLSPRGLFGSVPNMYLNLMRGLLNKNPMLRLDMAKAQQLLLAKAPVSEAFLYDLVAYAADLGSKAEHKRSEERLFKISDAVFAKLSSLSK